MVKPLDPKLVKIAEERDWHLIDNPHSKDLTPVFGKLSKKSKNRNHMKIAILGSMAFTNQMLAFKTQLETLGHQVFLSKFAAEYAGKTQEEIAIRTIDDKNNNDGLIELCDKIAQSDAVLVLNFEKKGIKNYIGGNTLIEMGYAFILGKKVILLNPVPEIEFYKSEIEAMQPLILNGSLANLPK